MICGVLAKLYYEAEIIKWHMEKTKKAMERQNPAQKMIDHQVVTNFQTEHRTVQLLVSLDTRQINAKSGTTYSVSTVTRKDTPEKHAFECTDTAVANTAESIMGACAGSTLPPGSATAI